jgi:hypothetical protein
MKYLDKTFVKPLIKPFIFQLSSYYKNLTNIDEIKINDENQLLHFASLYADLKLIIYSIALDADRNSMDIDNNNQTPLIKAVLSVRIFICLLFIY